MHTDHTRRVYRHTTPLSDVLFQGTTHTVLYRHRTQLSDVLFQGTTHTVVYRHTTPLSDVLFQGTTHTMCVPAQNSTVRCTFPRSSTHSHTHTAEMSSHWFHYYGTPSPNSPVNSINHN